jgi:hypothetical protein
MDAQWFDALFDGDYDSLMNPFVDYVSYGESSSNNGGDGDVDNNTDNDDDDGDDSDQGCQNREILRVNLYITCKIRLKTRKPSNSVNSVNLDRVDEFDKTEKN